MKYISHRGNINGKDLMLENSPKYIDRALKLGYDVEIDIRVIEGTYHLGHDNPTYGITQNWLNERADKIWIHCKNIEAVEWFTMIGGFNYFWHEEDKMTLTSKNYIWAYPGIDIKGSITVLPELHNYENIKNRIGICSDYIEEYRK
tara:strand:+ start:344 stop:781 length:438 start_codon:yes stop_codon:yes gene_type:complete